MPALLLAATFHPSPDGCKGDGVPVLALLPPNKRACFNRLPRPTNPPRANGAVPGSLAISQRMVALTGGSIRVVSRLGAGSRFTVDLRLPRATPRETENPGHGARDQPLLRSAGVVCRG